MKPQEIRLQDATKGEHAELNVLNQQGPDVLSSANSIYLILPITIWDHTAPAHTNLIRLQLTGNIGPHEDGASASKG